MAYPWPWRFSCCRYLFTLRLLSTASSCLSVDFPRVCLCLGGCTRSCWCSEGAVREVLSLRPWIGGWVRPPEPPAAASDSSVAVPAHPRSVGAPRAVPKFHRCSQRGGCFGGHWWGRVAAVGSAVERSVTGWVRSYCTVKKGLNNYIIIFWIRCWFGTLRQIFSALKRKSKSVLKWSSIISLMLSLNR